MGNSGDSMKIEMSIRNIDCKKISNKDYKEFGKEWYARTRLYIYAQNVVKIH